VPRSAGPASIPSTQIRRERWRERLPEQVARQIDEAAGVYPGLDRFGRVISQSWLDGVTGSTATGYRPAIVEQIHTYDLASNRLSKRDGRAGASWGALGAAGGAFESQSIVSGNCGAHQGTSFPPGAWVATQGGMAGTPFPAAVCSRR